MTALRLNLEFRAEVRCGPFSKDLNQSITDGIMVPDSCDHYDTGCGVSVSADGESAELFVMCGDEHIPINHAPLALGQTVIVRDSISKEGLSVRMEGRASYG